MNIDDPYTSM